MAGLGAAGATGLTSNPAWILVQRPSGRYLANTSFELRDTGPIMPLVEGEVRTVMVAAGTAPSLRGKMSSHPLGQPFSCDQVIRVVESRNSGYKTGAHFAGSYPLQRYITWKEVRGRAINVTDGLPAYKYLSILSMSAGLTAWHATEYVDTGRVEAPCRKTVIVTSAASATGMIAGQLYRLKGCRVLGVTSAPAKAARLRELGGFDAVIAYKTEDLSQRIKQLAPNGIDLDFENAGGPMLDTILGHMNVHGRVVLCGMIHDYDKAPKDLYGIRTAVQMINKRIRMEGIHVSDIGPHMAEASKQLASLVAQGKLRSEETVVHGFRKWPDAMRMILDSENMGRLVVLPDDNGEKLEL
uniref:Enoyl reductase (ER) domain-containing protein n=1 Tax=Pyrodinium bahamense TaxID=73915 RepID=A0A7S0FCR4_9DINO